MKLKSLRSRNLNSLGLHFLICKMGILSHRIVWDLKKATPDKTQNICSRPPGIVFLEQRPLQHYLRSVLGFLWEGKEFACNVGDPHSIPGSGRSPGEGNGYPLQYSCLENPTDSGAWWATVQGVAKSRPWLTLPHFHFRDPRVWGMKHSGEWRCYATGSQCLQAQSPLVCLRQIPIPRSASSDKFYAIAFATERAQKPLCSRSSPLSPPEGSTPPPVEQQSPLRTKKKLGPLRTEKVTTQNASLQRVSPWNLCDILPTTSKGSWPARKVKVISCSVVSDSGTPWTIQSTEFSRPEYWSG